MATSDSDNEELPGTAPPSLLLTRQNHFVDDDESEVDGIAADGVDGVADGVSEYASDPDTPLASLADGASEYATDAGVDWEEPADFTYSVLAFQTPSYPQQLRDFPTFRETRAFGYSSVIARSSASLAEVLDILQRKYSFLTDMPRQVFRYSTVWDIPYAMDAYLLSHARHMSAAEMFVLRRIHAFYIAISRVPGNVPELPTAVLYRRNSELEKRFALAAKPTEDIIQEFAPLMVPEGSPTPHVGIVRVRCVNVVGGRENGTTDVLEYLVVLSTPVARFAHDIGVAMEQLYLEMSEEAALARSMWFRQRNQAWIRDQARAARAAARAAASATAAFQAQQPKVSAAYASRYVPRGGARRAHEDTIARRAVLGSVALPDTAPPGGYFADSAGLPIASTFTMSQSSPFMRLHVVVSVDEAVGWKAPALDVGALAMQYAADADKADAAAARAVSMGGWSRRRGNRA